MTAIRQLRIYTLCVICISLLCSVCAQSQGGIPLEVNTNDGIVYAILIFLAVVNIATPIIRCLYVRYVVHMIAWTTEKFAELRTKVRERMSTAQKRPPTAGDAAKV